MKGHRDDWSPSLKCVFPIEEAQVDKARQRHYLVNIDQFMGI